MEIEAKLVIPTAAVLQQLAALESLGDYALRRPAVRSVTDLYLDTPERLFRQGGFACRLRHNITRGTWMATLKGLGQAADGLHQRRELETSVLPNALPGNWPQGEARDLALRLSHGQPLVKLFQINQIRQTREVERDDRAVAEFSLDEINYGGEQNGKPEWELEIELHTGGAPADLNALVAALAPFDLRPQPLSKFERQYKWMTEQVPG